MKEFEQLVRVWNLIAAGSVEFKLSQENEMIGILITKDTVEIDLKHPSAIQFISPFAEKFIEPKAKTKDHIYERGSIILGVLGALKAKRNDLSKYLTTFQELATFLNDNGKTVIIKEKGKQLAKLGKGADSFGMRLINLEHIEVNDLSALMRLMGELERENKKQNSGG
jgi:hypothetical protein